jgi:hypothetical protein
MNRARFETLMVAALVAHLASDQPAVLPAGGDLAWQWYCDLAAARTYSGIAPNAIGWGEIRAYAAMTGWPLSPDDCRLIMQMDRAFLANWEPPDADGATPAKRRKPSAPLTADGFDALFG